VVVFCVCASSIILGALYLLSVVALVNGEREYVIIAGSTLVIVVNAVGAVWIWVSKSVRVASIFGHLVVLTLLLAIFNTTYSTTGGRSTTREGDPQEYSLQVLPVAVAMVAFIFRERGVILAYTFGSMFVAGLAVALFETDRPDPVLARNLLVTAVTMLFVGLCLGYFGENATTLQGTADDAKEQMQAAQIEAELERKANEAKSRFVSVMSHEIRNPLQAVLLQLEMLASTDLAREQRSLLQGIASASQMLLTIVNDVLDVTKIESGAVALEAKPFSLRDLVEETVAANGPTAAKSGVDLTVFIDPLLPVNVVGDPTRVRQILQNLVHNALKFTAEGEVAVEVTLARDVFRVDERPIRRLWSLSVRDTGIGIDEAGQRKLFRAFSQVDESTTRRFGGTGLGLFICNELTNLMGGTISLTSEPDVGSTFTCTLMLEDDEERSKRSSAEVGPVRVVDTQVQWTIVVCTHSESLARVLTEYARYFFDAATDTTIEVAVASAAEHRLRTLAASASRTARTIVLIADADITSSLYTILHSLRSPNFTPVILAPDRSPRRTDELADEGWRFVVPTPVALAPLCSVLDLVVTEQQPAPAADEPFVTTRTSSSPSQDGGLETSGVRSDSERRTTTLGRRSDSSQLLDVRSSSSSHTFSPGQYDGPTRTTILVVDDFDLVRVLVGQTLEALGYRVLTARHGRAALELAEAHYEQIGFVLMDCEMPVMDGYEATLGIRRFERLVGVPADREVYVCAMSASSLREDIDKCYRASMSDFLAKPVTRGDLQQMVEEHARDVDEQEAIAHIVTANRIVNAAAAEDEPHGVGGMQRKKKKKKAKRVERRR
jgi:signal transduction histidine kinase/DNA-binding response OmpR family regulator